jgi:CRISPR-associated protein Cst2
MATNYLYGTILTNEAVAANNRGDNLGNTSTLQKVFHQDDVHTSVSAESIRFALRYRFQLENLETNRTFKSNKLEYKDEDRAYRGTSDDIFIDDDLMGYMDAKAAKEEKEDEVIENMAENSEELKAPEETKKKKTKGGRQATVRPSPLATGRAVSLRPYRGELSFNTVSGEKVKGKLSLYNAEMHTTEYQYSFGLNLDDVVNKENIGHLIDAIIDPPQVAGNHARFAYDFSPYSVVFRVTNAHSSKIQNCFEHDEENRTFTVARLIKRVESRDISADELIIGGEIANTDEGKQLKELGVTVLNGVAEAAKEARKRIAEKDEGFAILKQNGDKQ